MPDRRPRLVIHPDPDRLVQLVFDEVNDWQKTWPDHRAFVIVPETLKADMERRYITSHQAPGLLMAEILSFRRFGTRLFNEGGQQAGQTISSAGKAVLTQMILLDDRHGFRRFNRLAGKPRYASELVKVLGDFHRYNITADDLLPGEGGDRAPARRATIDKLHDFSCLKQALEVSIADRNLDDPDTALTRLAALLRSRPLPDRLTFLEDSRLWVLGFGNNRDFTSQERQVLLALAETCASLTIALAADPDRDNDLSYAHANRTLASLRRLLPAANFESLPRSDTKAPAAFHFLRAADRREEVRYVAGEIRRLLLTGGLRRRDIGIALCDVATGAAYLEPALVEYGIDAYLDSGKPLGNSSLMRWLRSLLALCDYDFSLDDLLDYYRSGLSGLEPDALDRFENEALARGWRSAADFRKRLPLDGEEINDPPVRSVLSDINRLLEFAATMRAARTGRAKSRLLASLCLAGNPPTAQLVERQRDRLMEEGYGEAARILVASWNAVIDYLEEAAELLADARLSQAHFSSMILAGLEELTLSSIPAGIDLVRVGSLSQMAGWPCQVLFVMGMTEAAFPPQLSQEGYLLDEERDYLARKTGKTFPNRKQDQPAATAWLIQALINRPERALYLSVPSLGDDSSRLYEEWLEQEGRGETILTKKSTGPDARWFTPKAAMDRIRWGWPTPPEWQKAVRELASRLPQLPSRAEAIAEDLTLPQTLVETVMQAGSGISVSMLQGYNACPFRFFLEYLAGAGDRIIAADRPDYQGTVLHRVMELAVSELVGALEAAPPEKHGALLQAWQDRLTPTGLRDCYQRAAEDPRLAWYRNSVFAGGIGERIIRRAADTLSLVAEFNHTARFTPAQLEWYFPSPGRPPYLLRAGGHAFTCRGLIDRVDANPSGLLRLIDYKRSAREFSWLDLYDGTDLQLPIYKRAYETAFPGATVEGLLFAGWKTATVYELQAFHPPGRTEEREGVKSLRKQMALWEGDQVERAAHYAEKKATDTLEQILSGRFPAKPRVRKKEESPCRYCAWYAACGYDGRLVRNRPLGDGPEDKNRALQMILGGGASSGQGPEEASGQG